MRRTGKWACINGVPCTVSWGLSKSSSVERYSASCTPDASGAVPGNINWTGTASGLGHQPAMMPVEDDFEFIGVASAEAGEILNYVADVLVTETTINIPVAAAGPIRWTSTFGVQGDVTPETATAHEDSTFGSTSAAKDGKIQIEETPDSDTYVDVSAVQDITLVFRRAVTTYVDAGLTYREVGNMEADVNFRVENDDLFVTSYAPNNIRRIKVFVTPSQFYLYDAIAFRELTNFTVDRVNNAILGYNVSGLWTAIRPRTPAALGSVLLPGGSPLYPAP